MTVLAEHRIRIQDAPALCLGILQTAFATPGADTIPFVSYTITRAEIVAFATARNALVEAKARRKHRPAFQTYHSRAVEVAGAMILSRGR